MMWKLQRICILKKKLKFWQQFFFFSWIGTHYTISLVKAIQQWWHLPVDQSANYYLWTPSWHPAGGESYWDNWNCACFGQGFFFHRGKKKEKMKLGKVEFCNFLQILALFLCLSGMNQAELTRSRSKPYFQSGRTRTKRSWVWNQFFVLEEYMGTDPLYVGKVGDLNKLWRVQMFAFSFVYMVQPKNCNSVSLVDLSEQSFIAWKKI